MKKIFFTLIIFCFVSAFNIVNASYIWEKKADFGGGPRDAAIGFSVGSFGYAGCGRTSNGFTNDLWEYNPVTDSWSQKMSYPGMGRFGLFSFSIGNLGYAGTGWTSSSFGTNDFYEYNPALNSWTQKNNFPGAARYTTSSFVIGNKAYVGLGCCSNQEDFYSFDATTGMWNQITSFPAPREGSFGFSVNGKGYVGGGYDDNLNSYNDMYEYDPSNDNWTIKASLPSLPRRAPVAFAIGEYGFVGMGYNDTTFMTDFYRYEPATNAWSIVASIGGIPRYWGFAFTIDNYGYSGAGSYNNIVHPVKVNDFWRFSDCDGSGVGIIAVPGNGENYFMHVTNSGKELLKLNYDIGNKKNVLFKIHNTLGQLVQSFELPSNSTDKTISHNLSAGIYLYTVSDASKIFVKGKLLIN